jgi:hypothetical protein
MDSQVLYEKYFEQNINFILLMLVLLQDEFPSPLDHTWGGDGHFLFVTSFDKTTAL